MSGLIARSHSVTSCPGPETAGAALPAQPVRPDSIGPQPVCRDAANLPARPRADEPDPVYQQTVAFLHWDPAAARSGYEPTGGRQSGG
jgi:hypothetical protein